MISIFKSKVIIDIDHQKLYVAHVAWFGFRGADLIRATSTVRHLYCLYISAL